MNWVDIAIITLLAVFTFESIGKSFLVELIDFLSFLLALFLSITFYNLASNIISSNFHVPASISKILGFGAVWFIVETTLFIVIHLTLPHFKTFWQLDRPLKALSIIPGFLRGLVFISILLVLIGTFPIQPKVKQAIDQSTLGSVILAKTHQLERPLKAIFGDITKETINFLTIKPKSNETLDLGFRTSDFTPNKNLENEMIKLINKERASLNLKPLRFKEQLREVARKHSADMFQRGYFSHFSPENQNVADRAQSLSIDYSIIGENLAYAPALDIAHKGLMDSPGHRANILSQDFSQVGIGIMDGNTYGLIITQVFSN